MPTTRIKEKLSTLVSTQLPEHITSDYPTFRLFLEKYYEFLEQDQNAQELLQNARSYADIDRTIDSFVDYFIDLYAKGIPKTILYDKRAFVKHASDLYKHKGTEDAFRILFRILFNEEIDFFYPNQVILKPSDGKWNKDYVLRASAITGSPFDLSGTQISGNLSNATALVESVLSFASGSDTIYEIYLNSDSVIGNFIGGENIIGRKLTNISTLASSVITANLYPIVSKIDIVDGGLGYVLNQSISIDSANGTGASGVVTSVTDAGAIREIQLSSYGYKYDTKPNVTISSPTATVIGTYKIVSNVATIRLSNNHSLLVGSNANVTFTANTLSDLNGSTKTLTISSVPNLKTVVISNIAPFRTGVITAQNANTSGNVTLSYTTNKFLTGRFTISDNLVRTTLGIEHGLKTNDNVNVIFNKTDVDSYTADFKLKNYNNVTVGFSETHNFVVNDKINVTFDSNYTNSTIGTYVLKTLPGASSNTANLYFNTAPHSFLTGQNVNVKFGLTITNAVSGTFLTIANVGIAYLNTPHSFKVNDSINVSFTSALLTDDIDKTLIKGNANITLGSNALVGNDTTFLSNLTVGNAITVNLGNLYYVANIASNTLVYLSYKAKSSETFANVYLATSNLNSNSTITAVTLVPNSKRIFFSIADKPNTSGDIVISNNFTNNLVNTFMTAVVVGNGYPIYNYIDVALPSGFANANSRGVVTVTNQDVSNIIGNTASQVTVLAIPNKKSIVFESNISSNIVASNGTVIVNSDLPGDIEDFSNVFSILSAPNLRTITFASSNANTRGNVTVFYSKAANLQANIGALGIGPGSWLDDSGRLDESFKIQGRIGTDERVYYQPFSYVIKSSQPLSAWREAVKKLLHPAGFEVFGEVVLTTTINEVQNVTAQAKFFPIKIVGNVDSSSTTVLADTLEYTADNLT